MTLSQLKYFVVVCETGSLSLASKQLFITQPALSAAIKQLEQIYHIQLFMRKNQGLVLTEEGEFFYQKAKQLLDIYEMFERDLTDLKDHQHKIRVGVPPMIGSFLFPKIYAQYMEKYPDAKFEIWEEGSLSIRKKLLSKTLDLGFSILNDSAKEHYNKEAILETELLYCVSKKSDLAGKASVSINDIKNESIILMREGFFQNQLINDMFADLSEKPKIILVSSQLSVIRNFVKMNAGGAFLMKELIDEADDSIVGIPFKNTLKLNIGLIWRKDAELRPGAQTFINFLRQTKK